MRNMKKIKINQELNTFEDADTQSGIIGKIKVGTYDIVEIRENYPNTSTDYVKLFDLKLQKNVWICSRYKQTKYAFIVQSTPDFSGDLYAIEEKALTRLLPAFNSFTYDLHSPTYPLTLWL